MLPLNVTELSTELQALQMRKKVWQTASPAAKADLLAASRVHQQATNLSTMHKPRLVRLLEQAASSNHTTDENK